MTTKQIFDPSKVRRRRERSVRSLPDADFLHSRVMDDVCDRLETVMRDFPQAAFDGAGALIDRLSDSAGVNIAFSLDVAAGRLGTGRSGKSAPQTGSSGVLADPEALPFKPASLDLFVSALRLHTVNDPMRALREIRACLKPDGLFIGALFAENTLSNLRECLYRAESEIRGGISPRIGPFANVQSLGSVMAGAGLALPVVDVDRVRVRYPNPRQLFRDLRSMGETSALAQSNPPLTRKIIDRSMALFTQNFEEEIFEIAYMTGWAPAPGQPKARAPGSATHSLEAVVKKLSPDVS